MEEIKLQERKKHNHKYVFNGSKSNLLVLLSSLPPSDANCSSLISEAVPCCRATLGLLSLPAWSRAGLRSSPWGLLCLRPRSIRFSWKQCCWGNCRRCCYSVRPVTSLSAGSATSGVGEPGWHPHAPSPVKGSGPADLGVRCGHAGLLGARGGHGF